MASTDTLSVFSGENMKLPSSANKPKKSLNPITEDQQEDAVYRRSKNDLKDIKSFKQLDKLDLSIDSPRFQ